MQVTLHQPVTVYKKARLVSNGKPVIVELYLSKGTRINIGIGIGKDLDGRKCRAEKAKVVSIQSVKPLSYYDYADYCTQIAVGYGGFKYKVGKVVKPDYFDKTNEVCSGGIHFFFERSDAEKYKV